MAESPEGFVQPAAAYSHHYPRARSVQRGTARGLPLGERPGGQEAPGRHRSTDLAERYSKVEVAETLDRAQGRSGSYWATRSGVTDLLSDVVAPPPRPRLLAREEKAARCSSSTSAALITDSERRQELDRDLDRATDEGATAMQENFPETNTVHMMVTSGARGNYMQVRQIAGMRGSGGQPEG